MKRNNRNTSQKYLLLQVRKPVFLLVIFVCLFSRLNAQIKASANHTLSLVLKKNLIVDEDNSGITEKNSRFIKSHSLIFPEANFYTSSVNSNKDKHKRVTFSLP
jgi:hypothetical protein